MLRRLSHVTLGSIFHILPIRRLKRGPTVVTYHGVDTQISDSRVQRIHIQADEFEKQIRYVRQNFDVVTMDELSDSIVDDRHLNPQQVVLTFDDGYRNNLTVAAPVMKAHNLPFTVFISAAYIDKQERFPIYTVRTSIYYTECQKVRIEALGKEFDLSSAEAKTVAEKAIVSMLRKSPEATVKAAVGELTRLIPQERWDELNEQFSSDQTMTWDEVRELQAMGATIGSHCNRHMILHSNQDSRDVSDELRDSKAAIEEQVGKCDYFAFPNGSLGNVSRSAWKEVKESGYRLGFSSARGVVPQSPNPFILPRIGCGASVEQLRMRLNTSFRYNKGYDAWRGELERV